MFIGLILFFECYNIIQIPFLNQKYMYLLMNSSIF
jgi:hypothetical protein